MISYCRNLEDVIIQRALADVPAGHYLDIGASHPVTDSTTYALYERGWSGIAVDPILDQDMWRSQRPRDLALCAMAGAAAGSATLHVYAQALQSCTGSEAVREHLAKAGYLPARQLSVPLVAADDLLAPFAARPLHLLSIDAEGMEAEVLAGLDLSRHRPWLMVIEAVLVGTPCPVHQAWEPRLLEMGYRLVYLDGVNRYYLAVEQHGLLGHFALPPNIWDCYLRDSDRQTELRIAELEAQVALMSAELMALRGRR